MGAEANKVYFTDARPYNLDSKSRLSLPSDFRKQLGEKVVLVAFFDSVYGFTPEGHEEWVNRLFAGEDVDRSVEASDFMLWLMGQTKTVDIDSAGRISLTKISEDDRVRLGLAKEVMVVGNRDHFEVWSSDAWQEKMASRSLSALRSFMYRS